MDKKVIVERVERQNNQQLPADQTFDCNLTVHESKESKPVFMTIGVLKTPPTVAKRTTKAASGCSRTIPSNGTTVRSKSFPLGGSQSSDRMTHPYRSVSQSALPLKEKTSNKTCTISSQVLNIQTNAYTKMSYQNPYACRQEASSSKSPKEHPKGVKYYTLSKGYEAGQSSSRNRPDVANAENVSGISGRSPKRRSIKIFRKNLTALNDDSTKKSSPSSSVETFLEQDMVQKGAEVLDRLDDQSLKVLVTKVMGLCNKMYGDYLAEELEKHLGIEKYREVARQKLTTYDEFLARKHCDLNKGNPCPVDTDAGQSADVTISRKSPVFMKGDPKMLHNTGNDAVVTAGRSGEQQKDQKSSGKKITVKGYSKCRRNVSFEIDDSTMCPGNPEFLSLFDNQKVTTPASKSTERQDTAHTGASKMKDVTKSTVDGVIAQEEKNAADIFIAEKIAEFKKSGTPPDSLEEHFTFDDFKLDNGPPEKIFESPQDLALSIPRASCQDKCRPRKLLVDGIDKNGNQEKISPLAGKNKVKTYTADNNKTTSKHIDGQVDGAKSNKSESQLSVLKRTKQPPKTTFKLLSNPSEHVPDNKIIVSTFSDLSFGWSGGSTLSVNSSASLETLEENLTQLADVTDVHVPVKEESRKKTEANQILSGQATEERKESLKKRTVADNQSGFNRHKSDSVEMTSKRRVMNEEKRGKILHTQSKITVKYNSKEDEKPTRTIHPEVNSLQYPQAGNKSAPKMCGKSSNTQLSGSEKLQKPVVKDGSTLLSPRTNKEEKRLKTNQNLKKSKSCGSEEPNTELRASPLAIANLTVEQNYAKMIGSQDMLRDNKKSRVQSTDKIHEKPVVIMSIEENISLYHADKVFIKGTAGPGLGLSQDRPKTNKKLDKIKIQETILTKEDVSHRPQALQLEVPLQDNHRDKVSIQENAGPGLEFSQDHPKTGKTLKTKTQETISIKDYVSQRPQASHLQNNHRDKVPIKDNTGPGLGFSQDHPKTDKTLNTKTQETISIKDYVSQRPQASHHEKHLQNNHRDKVSIKENAGPGLGFSQDHPKTDKTLKPKTQETVSIKEDVSQQPRTSHLQNNHRDKVPIKENTGPGLEFTQDHPKTDKTLKTKTQKTISIKDYVSQRPQASHLQNNHCDKVPIKENTSPGLGFSQNHPKTDKTLKPKIQERISIKEDVSQRLQASHLEKHLQNNRDKVSIQKNAGPGLGFSLDHPKTDKTLKPKTQETISIMEYVSQRPQASHLEKHVQNNHGDKVSIKGNTGPGLGFSHDRPKPDQKLEQKTKTPGTILIKEGVTWQPQASEDKKYVQNGICIKTLKEADQQHTNIVDIKEKPSQDLISKQDIKSLKSDCAKIDKNLEQIIKPQEAILTEENASLRPRALQGEKYVTKAVLAEALKQVYQEQKDKVFINENPSSDLTLIHDGIKVLKYNCTKSNQGSETTLAKLNSTHNPNFTQEVEQCQGSIVRCDVNSDNKESKEEKVPEKDNCASPDLETSMNDLAQLLMSLQGTLPIHAKKTSESSSISNESFELFAQNTVKSLAIDKNDYILIGDDPEDDSTKACKKGKFCDVTGASQHGNMETTKNDTKGDDDKSVNDIAQLLMNFQKSGVTVSSVSLEASKFVKENGDTVRNDDCVLVEAASPNQSSCDDNDDCVLVEPDSMPRTKLCRSNNFIDPKSCPVKATGDWKQTKDSRGTIHSSHSLKNKKSKVYERRFVEKNRVSISKEHSYTKGGNNLKPNHHRNTNVATHSFGEEFEDHKTPGGTFNSKSVHFKSMSHDSGKKLPKFVDCGASRSTPSTSKKSSLPQKSTKARQDRENVPSQVKNLEDDCIFVDGGKSIVETPSSRKSNKDSEVVIPRYRRSLKVRTHLQRNFLRRKVTTLSRVIHKRIKTVRRTYDQLKMFVDLINLNRDDVNLDNRTLRCKIDNLKTIYRQVNKTYIAFKNKDVRELKVACNKIHLVQGGREGAKVGKRKRKVEKKEGLRCVTPDLGKIQAASAGGDEDKNSLFVTPYYEEQMLVKPVKTYSYLRKNIFKTNSKSDIKNTSEVKQDNVFHYKSSSFFDEIRKSSLDRNKNGGNFDENTISEPASESIVHCIIYKDTPVTIGKDVKEEIRVSDISGGPPSTGIVPRPPSPKVVLMKQEQPPDSPKAAKVFDSLRRGQKRKAGVVESPSNDGESPARKRGKPGNDTVAEPTGGPTRNTGSRTPSVQRSYSLRSRRTGNSI